MGAAVMNCDPFTLGHRYLIETAARECDRVFVFVLSEDRGHFPAADRLELVRQGTADLKNVTVLPTGTAASVILAPSSPNRKKPSGRITLSVAISVAIMLPITLTV